MRSYHSNSKRYDYSKNKPQYKTTFSLSYGKTYNILSPTYSLSTKPHQFRKNSNKIKLYFIGALVDLRRYSYQPTDKGKYRSIPEGTRKKTKLSVFPIHQNRFSSFFLRNNDWFRWNDFWGFTFVKEIVFQN